ncbi:MAG: MFS transporter, partial [Gemmatimonadota bacterium]|nr:MFS transporter [Gemmatimonadota bacterium]
VLRRAVDVRPSELTALVGSFVYFYFALASWFVLRPMRDTVAASIGSTELSVLWIGTLGTMLVANAVFSAVVVRLPPRKFIPYAYHTIALSLVVFYFAFRTYGAAEGSVSDLRMEKAFYVWTSVFNLFVTSLFWCFMADVFRSDQAKRLFGFIGVGGTLGSITGSAATAALARALGPANLLLVSVVLLEIAVLAVMRFPRIEARGAAGTAGAVGADGAAGAPIAVPGPATEALGGRAIDGFTNVVRSPYLTGIAVFLALFTFGSTFLYFEQSAIVGAVYPDRASRTEVLAQIELAVQVLTVVTQIFFTGRIIRWFGLVTGLAFLPALSIVGFGAIGAMPTFAAVAAFVVLRRAGNFALTNPSMEVLFTVVPREDKYKAKAFIETFVYRGGDQLGAWVFAGLIATGISHGAVAWLAVPISAGWLVLSVWLARRQAALAAAHAGPGAGAAVNAVAPPRPAVP